MALDGQGNIVAAPIDLGPVTDVVALVLYGTGRDEQGQDPVEYTLLLGFVALTSAALLLGAGDKISSIWTIANNQLDNAATSASS